MSIRRKPKLTKGIFEFSHFLTCKAFHPVKDKLISKTFLSMSIKNLLRQSQPVTISYIFLNIWEYNLPFDISMSQHVNWEGKRLCLYLKPSPREKKFHWLSTISLRFFTNIHYGRNESSKRIYLSYSSIFDKLTNLCKAKWDWIEIVFLNFLYTS